MGSRASESQRGWQPTKIDGIGGRTLGYPNVAEANEASAAQIAAHRPIDNTKTTLIAARLVS